MRRSPNALLLCVVSQPVFFAYWAGLITLKIAAVTEQTLVMAIVASIVLGISDAGSIRLALRSRSLPGMP